MLNEIKEQLKEIYFNYFWWSWQIILVLLSGGFFVFGVEILIRSYQLNNPAYFMMIFFASNLIISISLVLMAGLLYRIYGVYKLIYKKKEDKETADKK